MRIKTLIICYVINVAACFAQSGKGLVGKFTFNSHKMINEIDNMPAGASSYLSVEDRFGNPESACYLHGSPGSYINLGVDPLLKPRKGTISMWFQMDIISYAGIGYKCNPLLLTKNNNADDFYESYSITYSYDVKKLVASSSLSENLQVKLFAKDTLTFRVWHQAAIAYNDDSLWFYVDGNLQAKIIKGFRTVFSKTDSILIGISANKKNDRFFCGSVDDILIYNRVLSPTEILNLYESPNPNEYRTYLRWIYRLLGLTVLIASFVWLIVRRYKKEIKKQGDKNRMSARLNELETKAIRAQMNPHFIFNSLNTLQRFILEENYTLAHNYLTQFSELLRKLLESSASDSISLKEEIDILTNYIKIEKLRFDDSFKFSIHSDISEPESTQVPFMLIQPLVENAIWHGLLPKEGRQILKITFRNSGDSAILCQVDDNGVGRQDTTEHKYTVKRKSMALDFISQRLDILEKVTGIKGSLKIIDKKNGKGESEGTCVEIIIPKIK